MREGYYAFSNDTHINAMREPKNNKQLVRHEFVHKKTVGASTYGTLLMMMEKASLIDDSKKWLFNELLDIYIIRCKNKRQLLLNTLLLF
ncbi:hypothetical protein ICS_05719 [Bacillus cereus BAG2O-3]|nr:hypothetical protein ICS_05719 [Bacillus cereus BAG2O-3]